MKKALIILLAIVFILSAANIAFARLDIALTPTTFDSTGASRWHFGDKYDTVTPTGVVGEKHEGSYRQFDQTGTLIINSIGGSYQINNTDILVYEMADNTLTSINEAISGPHGGYISATNKCKACHAVHRAQGIYYLLRADDSDSACDFCHVGSAPHSNRVAYYRSTEGKYTSNGHTIGSGPEIPDSSVWQWEETATIYDADDNTITVQVRQYSATENQIFKIGGHGARKRTGPYRLQCQTCHQVHNATMLTWKPGDDSAGYMLLRNAPSGSVDSQAIMENRTDKTADNQDIIFDTYRGSPPNAVLITVPETTITSTNTGLQPNGSRYTIWTRWQGPDTGVKNGNFLAVWCADCHNLNIGYPRKDLGSNFGQNSHTARTHPVPYMQSASDSTFGILLASNAPQCESCHVTDMYPETGGGCGETCHITPMGYSLIKGKSDYPHSGDEGSTKLLGDMPDTLGGNAYVYYDGQASGFGTGGGTLVETNTPYNYTASLEAAGLWTSASVTTAYDKSFEHIDQICLRCHAEDIGIYE
ncbi:MAG: hypothetical protein QME63_02180 [Actinomycetota bacterium]|nr:hypothetical protein [Actinomycetota bacterium]